MQMPLNWYVPYNYIRGAHSGLPQFNQKSEISTHAKLILQLADLAPSIIAHQLHTSTFSVISDIGTILRTYLYLTEFVVL